MGTKTSKISDEYYNDIYTNDNNILKPIEQNKMLVIFFQVREADTCFFRIDDFAILLGENPNEVPMYSILENSHYPYLFCADHQTNIKKICDEFGFEIGFYAKQLVDKEQFNSSYKTTYDRHNIDCFKLEPIK